MKTVKIRTKTRELEIRITEDNDKNFSYALFDTTNPKKAVEDYAVSARFLDNHYALYRSLSYGDSKLFGITDSDKAEEKEVRSRLEAEIINRINKIKEWERDGTGRIPLAVIYESSQKDAEKVLDTVYKSAMKQSKEIKDGINLEY